MKYESPDICLPVSLSGSLYYRLIEVLKESQAHPDPNAAIVTAVRRFVAEATPTRKTPRKSTANAAVSAAWSNDWIMFGAPPASTSMQRTMPTRRFVPTEAPTPASTPTNTAPVRQRGGDWCVGCSGADTDLLEG